MRLLLLPLALLIPLLSANAAENPDDIEREFQSLNWRKGPATESIGSRANIKTDASLAFLDEKDTSKFLELTGNVPRPGHYTLASPQGNWFSVFSFNPMGYVKDDEKIDADALLQQLKDSDAPSNEERKKIGAPPLFTEGWYVQPHYDVETKQLEWGIKLRSEGKIVLNYTVRLLGRTGVMNATLVSSPETLDADVKSFKNALRGYEFSGGERYAEFKPGDKIAEYGLAALVVGGAAAVATKKGFWAVLATFFAAAWKFIAAAALGLLAWLASFFKKKG